jgi:hypothetical protein
MTIIELEKSGKLLTISDTPLRADDRRRVAQLTPELRPRFAVLFVLSLMLFAASAHAQNSGLLLQTSESNAEIFHYQANDSDVVMRPVATHQCFLTEATGNLDEDAGLALHRSVADMHDRWKQKFLTTVSTEDGDDWKLGGWSDNSESRTAGEAVCVPLSDFILDDGGVTWISEMFSTSVSAGDGFSCKNHSGINAWRGDAATFISGFRGDFGNFGDKIWVELGTPSTPSSAHVSSEDCSINWFEVDAYSFFAGVPSTENYPNYSTFSHRSRPHQTAVTPLIRTRDGVCYFTSIAGNFRGNGERIRILPTWVGDEEWWALETLAVGGEVEAGVSCLNYDQRHDVIAPD